MSTRKQRRALAGELAEIVVRHGGQVEISEGGVRNRQCTVQCTWPGKVDMSFDVDDLHGGGVLYNWYNASKPLQEGAWFMSVNKCHGRKATSYGHNAGLAKKALTEGCEAVADGRAFVDGT